MNKRMDVARPRTVVLWAVLCGALAGLVAATYFSFAGEPAIEDAIAIEESMAMDDAAQQPGSNGEGHDSAEDAVGGNGAQQRHDSSSVDEGVEVSRTTQRGVGLFSAYAVFGAGFGVLLAVTTLTLRGDWLAPFRRVVVAGTILAGAVTVVPWFKYPPNPPAVGDPATADDRQRWYLLLIALAGLVLASAAHLSARLRGRGWDVARRTAVVGGVTTIALGVVLAVLPANDDAIPAAMPTSLIWRFRTASLGGNVLLWSVLVVGFGLLYSEAAKRRAAAVSAQNSMPFIADTPAS